MGAREYDDGNAEMVNLPLPGREGVIMAGISWIKIETTLPRKPVVYQVAMALGVDDLTVIGALISLLCWADGVTADGTIGKGGDVIIDRVCGLKGLSDALIDAGWLSKDADGVVAFNEWDTHNGENAKKRALNVRKVVKCRANKALTESGYKCNQKRLTSVDDALTESGQLDKNRIDKNDNTDVLSNAHAKGFVTSGQSHVEIPAAGATTVFPATGREADFLNAYCRRPKDVSMFRREYVAALEECRDEATLIECARLAVEKEREAEGNIRFLPTPENWLADRRYRDYICTAKVTRPVALPKLSINN